MLLNTLLKALFNLFLVAILFACQGPDPSMPASPRFRLIRGARSAESYHTFSYNTENKLDTLAYFFAAPRKIVTVATYDAQGRLSVVTELPWEKFLGRKQTFTYDQQGGIKNIGTAAQLGPQAFGEPQIATVSYNNNGQIAEISKSAETTLFTYTDGNVTQQQYINTESPDLNKTTTYQYDDKPNPYHGLYVWGGIDPAVLSKNNQVLPDGKYEYDSNNLLIRATTLNGESFAYSYEQY